MECERCNQQDALRQGDIFAANPGSDNWNDPWTRFGVIITADCDIDKQKNGNHLVYIPLLSYDTYLKEIWLPEESERLFKTCRDALDKSLATFDQKFTSRHVLSWEQREGVEGVEKRLKDATQPRRGCEKQSEKTLSLLASFRALEDFAKKDRNSPEIKFKSICDEFFSIREKIYSTDHAQSRTTSIEQVLNSVQQRLDMWLIRNLIDLDTDMVYAAGFGLIAPLRRFGRIEVGRITLTKDEWYGSKEKLYRICRLRGIYKADLLHNFANLFVRPGLDDGRDAEHQRAFRRYADGLR
jgi:hypothetical protein